MGAGTIEWAVLDRAELHLSIEAASNMASPQYYFESFEDTFEVFSRRVR
jgi:hypothetical protein